MFIIPVLITRGRAHAQQAICSMKKGHDDAARMTSGAVQLLYTQLLAWYCYSSAVEARTRTHPNIPRQSAQLGAAFVWAMGACLLAAVFDFAAAVRI